MKGKLFFTALALAMTLTATPLLADQYYDYARVISVTPKYERVRTGQPECYDDTPRARTYRRSDERSYGGPILGGITGAIIGNQIGGGHGKEAATALGAITGAIVGDRIQNSDGSWEPRPQQRCRNVDRWEDRIVGYNVLYEYGGRRYSSFMGNDPGNEVRVQVSVTPTEY